MGNRIASIVDLVPPERWKHVVGTENPADCGLFPSELIDHKLWWNGPVWLEASPDEWPRQPTLSLDCFPEWDREVCHVATTLLMKPTCVVFPSRYSSFEHLRRVIAWIIRYVNNCRPQRFKHQSTYYITVHELNLAEIHLFSVIQVDHFSTEIDLIKSNQSLPKGNCYYHFPHS